MVQNGKPWLSVIIPVYNAEKYLDACLKSIRKQTFQEYEVILIDDGSSDESGKVCKRYSEKDPRFHYFRKENGGSFQTRIYGAEKATGEFITFCDADDYYHTINAFQTICLEISRNKCDVLQFGYLKKYNHMKRSVISSEKPLNVSKEIFQKEEYPKLLCSIWSASHLTQNVWNKVYHRSLAGNLPSSLNAERIFWGDDLILNLYMLSSCMSIRFIPDILYEYRQFSGETSRFSLHTMKDLDCIKLYQLKFLEGYDSELKKDIIRNLHGETAGWLFYYIRQASENLDEADLEGLIEETLQMTAIANARRYFIEENNENWDGVNLLRKADPGEYIKKAKEYQNKEGIKDRIRTVIRKIYTSI